MIDVKKFISGFLVLALAAIASGFVLSYIGGSSTTAQAPAGPQIIGINATNSGASPGAFVDDASSSVSIAALQAELDTSSTDVAANDPNNLTNIFANSLVSGFVAANPDGIGTDSNGNDQVNLPDANELAQDITSGSALQNFKAPDWGAQIGQQKIEVTDDNSTSTINLYASALGEVYQRYVGSTDIGSILGDDNPGDAVIVSNQTGEMAKTLESFHTPSSLAKLHASLVELLLYEKDYADVIQNETNDPIRASLTLQAEQSGYELAINNFKDQWQAVTGQQFPTSVSSNDNSDSIQSDPQTSEIFSFINNLLGVPTAYAVAGVGDIVSDPVTELETTSEAGSDLTIASVATQNLPLQAHSVVINSAIFGVENGQLSVSTAALAATIEKYAQDVALQIAINAMTSLMQRKVLTWIQGSGAPRFVTDWGVELANSFTTAATNQLNNWMTCIPPYQAPIIRALLTTPTTALNNACAGEFNGQLAYNFQNLSNSFSNFTNYLNLFQPGGNGWGLVVQVQDSVLSNASAAQKANTNQNLAQQGWKASSAGTCDDGSSPNGSADLCVSSNGNNYYIDPNNPSDKCDPSDQLEFIPNNGSCPDGNNPKITSPGQVTGQGFFTALKAGPESITSAKNIAGLLNALATSLLNTLAQSAISFSTSQINNALNGMNGGATDSGLVGINAASITTTSSTQSGVQCIPATQTSALVSNSVATVTSATIPSASSLLANTSSSQASASFSAAGGALDTTCASGGACPSTENPDGSPIYSWSAPGSLGDTGGVDATGTSFFATYNTPGTYVVTVSASTDNTTSTCAVTVQ
jgi:hypothetical protein